MGFVVLDLKYGGKNDQTAIIKGENECVCVCGGFVPLLLAQCTATGNESSVSPSSHADAAI